MKKRILAALLAAAMALCLLPAAALAAEGEFTIELDEDGIPTSSGASGDGWRWSFSGDLVSIINGTLTGFTPDGRALNYIVRTLNNGGIIAGGCFLGPVTNAGITTGGVFAGAAGNGGTITGGYFASAPIGGGSFGGTASVVSMKELTVQSEGATEALLNITTSPDLRSLLQYGGKGVAGEKYLVSAAGGISGKNLIGLYLLDKGTDEPTAPYSIDNTKFSYIQLLNSYEFTMPDKDVYVYAVFHTPVTNITGVPATAAAGVDLTLTGTVAPENATYSDIIWSVTDAGNTGASINGNVLSTTAAGTATVTATVENGTAEGTPYTQDFDITVKNLPAVRVNGTDIYANGNALIITGASETSSTIYIDTNRNGRVDEDEKSLEDAGVVDAPADDADLSRYFVCGGGAAASHDTLITMLSGSVRGIYGGGRGGSVTGSTSVNIKGGTVAGSIYGGGGQGTTVSGNTSVTLSDGTVVGDIYGGGGQATSVGGKASVNISGGTVKGSVYGRGADDTATVSGTKTVSVSGAPVIGGVETSTSGVFINGIRLDTVTGNKVTISDALTSGALINLMNPSAETSGTVVAEAATAAHADAQYFTMQNATLKKVGAQIQIDSFAQPTVDDPIIYANGYALLITGTSATSTTIYIDTDRDGELDDDELSLARAGVANAPADNSDHRGWIVYGGGTSAGMYNTLITMRGGCVHAIFGGGYGPVTGSTSIDIKGGTTNFVVGGSGASATVSGDTSVNISGGRVNTFVCGGGDGGTVGGNTSVNISGGRVIQYVYGGGTRAATVSGTRTVSVSGNPVISAGIHLDTITDGKVTISDALTDGAAINLVYPSATDTNTVVARATTPAHADATKFTLTGYTLAADTTAGTVYIEGAAVTPTAVAFNSVAANGGSDATTTALTLTFDKDVEGLTADDITLTGATKGALTKAAGQTGVYTLAISDVTVAHGATVTVAVAKTGFTFDPASQTVAVNVYTPPGTVAPAITGDTEMTLTVGYAAQSTGEYTITGNPTPTVTASGNASITWNNATSKLDIAAGLMAGTYPVTLTAENGVLPDATHTFTLTVEEPAAQLATPTDLHWSDVSEISGVWSAVANAASYRVQLYVDGTAQANKHGGELTAANGTVIDLSPHMTASGERTYYFKVQAIGDGATYTNSEWSAASDGYDYTYSPPPTHVPVTGITGVPTTATTGVDLTLIGTVEPSDATNKTIVWSIDGTNTLTGASISNGKLVTTTAGTAKVLATIANGASATTDYTQVFEITVSDATPQQHTITVTANPTAGGTVTGGGTFDENTSRTVEATANAGYHFVRWTEGGTQVSTSASYTFSLTADRSLVAVFELSSNPPASDNSISGITVGQVYTLGDTVTFTANGGGMSNTNPNANDTRWLPTSWATNPSGNFNSGFTQSFSTTGMTVGSHTLTVTFTKQQYSGTAWANVTPAVTDTKSVNFTVSNAPPAPSAPTITNPTTDRTITVVVGDTATLTVTATDATGYQWWINRGSGWTAISGATGASYTTSPVTMNNNGYQYRCVVSNANGSVTSPIFTLNVIEQPDIPATGDNSMPGLWLGIMLMAAGALAASIVLGRRKRHGN